MICSSASTENGTVLKSTESSKEFPTAWSTPNLSPLTTNTITSRDEELLTFLNTPDSSPRKDTAEVSMSPPTPSSLMVEHPTDTTDSVSELSIHSGRSTPSFIHTSVDVSDHFNRNNVNDNNDNSCKNETINSLNTELVGNQAAAIALDNGKYSLLHLHHLRGS